MPENFKLDLIHRPRRLRRTASLRALVEETVLRPQDFIAPLFVIDGTGGPEAVASMPGVFRLNLADLAKECRALHKLGVPAVALFPSLDPRLKDEEGSRRAARGRARAARRARGEEGRAGADGDDRHRARPLHDPRPRRRAHRRTADDVDNDRTVGILCQMAVLHARAGVDLVAPSRHDGRPHRRDPPRARRRGLHGHGHHGLLGEIRLGLLRAVPRRRGQRQGGGHATLLSKATYQLNPANRREALIEIALDEAEGADILMVKPAGAYLDIIREVRNATNKPVAAYQVSGEYAQIHAAAQIGWLDSPAAATSRCWRSSAPAPT